MRLTRVAIASSRALTRPVTINNCLPSSPLSAQAIPRFDAGMRRVMVPPSSTRTNSMVCGEATHTAPSASRQMPSGAIVPRSAQTRRLFRYLDNHMCTTFAVNARDLMREEIREPEFAIAPARGFGEGEVFDEAAIVGHG